MCIDAENLLSKEDGDGAAMGLHVMLNLENLCAVQIMGQLLKLLN